MCLVFYAKGGGGMQLTKIGVQKGVAHFKECQIFLRNSIFNS